MTPASLPKTLVNSVGMKFALIPAGAFLMGSPSEEKRRSKDEEQHEVEITKTFYLGVFEVTQQQWRAVMGSNPSSFNPDGVGGDTQDFPVESVSWPDVQSFLERLAAREEEKKGGRKYRLPTEAEWEYACRGGASDYQVFHYGNSLSSAQANFNGNYPYEAAPGPYLERPSKAGSYEPNGFGLYGHAWQRLGMVCRLVRQGLLQEEPATRPCRAFRGLGSCDPGRQLGLFRPALSVGLAQWHRAGEPVRVPRLSRRPGSVGIGQGRRGETEGATRPGPAELGREGRRWHRPCGYS